MHFFFFKLMNHFLWFSYHSQLFLSVLHKHRSPPSTPVCRAGLSTWGAPEQSWFSSAATRKPRCSCAAENALGKGEWLPVHGTTGTQENLWDMEISPLTSTAGSYLWTCPETGSLIHATLRARELTEEGCVRDIASCAGIYFPTV